MLTATYTLVALSVEQASVRVSLASFQKYVQSNLLHQAAINAGQLDYACEMLRRLYRACHWRKIEMFLIPAIRGATAQADALLQELGALNQQASELIDAVVALRHGAGADTEALAAQLCEAVDAFCATLLRRIDKEERELFPLAHRLISGERWFSIANQILVHDAHRQESRRGTPPAAPGAAEPAAADTVAAAAPAAQAVLAAPLE